MPHEDAVQLDLSAALCEPIRTLSAEIHGLRAALPPATLRRVWPPIAAAIDEMLYTRVVRKAAFSPRGVSQLRRDVSALAAIFEPLVVSAGSGVVLRRLHDSCTLLTLNTERRTRVLNLALSDSPPLAQRAEHEGRLQALIEGAGVHFLRVGEATELLASVHAE